MVKVLISDASRALLEAHAQGNMLKPAVKVVGGNETWLDDDVYEELMQISTNIDEAIRLVCTPSAVGHA